MSDVPARTTHGSEEGSSSRDLSQRTLTTLLRALLKALATSRPELRIALPFVLLFLVCLLVPLPLSLPDQRGLAFIQRHYFGPLVAAAVLQGVVLFFHSKSGEPSSRARALLWLGGLMGVTILMHFNFKAWMPLVHRELFDKQLLRSDQLLGSLVPALIGVRQALAEFARSRLGFNVDSLYHWVFVAMFFVAFSAHAVFDSVTGMRRVVSAACLVLLLGGVLYWLVPAKGPFIFRGSVNLAATNAQSAMEGMFDDFARTGAVPAGYFAAPLAAVPSLHTAHATLFCIYAWRRLRVLCVLFVPALVWILLEAIATGWHYVVDLPAGAALAWFSVWCVDRLLPEEVSTAVTPPQG